MSRKTWIRTVTAAAVWMTAFTFDSADAQYPAQQAGYVRLAGNTQPSLLPAEVGNVPALPAAAYQAAPASRFVQPLPGQGVDQYPDTGAAMYPCPVPNVPYQIGGTMVTNQALNPHEMLYPHKYKALYPPFYYEVKGGWLLTPWGVRSYDRWTLTGTMVKVKYRPRIALFSGFYAF